MILPLCAIFDGKFSEKGNGFMGTWENVRNTNTNRKKKGIPLQNLIDWNVKLKEKIELSIKLYNIMCYVC